MTLFSQTVGTPGGGSYPVLVGEDASAELPALAGALHAARVVVISDSNVEPLHAAEILGRLRSAGIPADGLAFPAGEASKSRAVKEHLEDRMLGLGCGRDTAVVALGGGVTGDLAGFVAATFMRGVPWIQAPTSLLAMADASVGGKTGVDHPLGKNLIGAFHHPAAVAADTRFLETLPVEEFRWGMAEIVKAAIVADASLFEALEMDASALAGCDRRAAEQPLRSAVAVKVQVVTGDPGEAGRRRILNFGHTVGHALERVMRYGMPHGKAVSLGMVAEARLAARLGLLDPGAVERIRALLESLRLPVRLPGGPAPEEILEAAATDKKARRGAVEFALPARIGEMALQEGRWSHRVPDEEVLGALGELLGGPEERQPQ